MHLVVKNSSQPDGVTATRTRITNHVWTPRYVNWRCRLRCKLTEHILLYILASCRYYSQIFVETMLFC